ncbi:MAG: hypothetical protein LBO09_05240 [Candidatus Peribacteria bacterium]|jgi:hypothetical protein|nr:hypothetical protein [Candidatus Peribacteria bacterium]
MEIIKPESYLALMASEGVQSISYKKLREFRMTLENKFPHIYIEIVRYDLYRTMHSLPIFTMEDTEIIIHADKVIEYKNRIQDKLITILDLPQEIQITMKEVIATIK